MNAETIKWQDLDQFTKAYIECALWSSTGDDGEPLDASYDQFDIAPETLQTMQSECADFQEANRDMLDRSGLNPCQAGHDFWLTRNGHGAGFWDRGLGKVGQQLTDMSKPHGSADLYVGDDGKVYQS